MPMRVQTFYPKNLILKKHIEYYYFLTSWPESFETAYYAFPNTSQSFNIHKNACCKIESNATLVYGVKEKGYRMIVQGRYESPLLVRLEGKLDKVTIIFRPLGLNHFIEKPLADLAPLHSQFFNEWDHHIPTPHFLESFFREKDNEVRVGLLEDFLLLFYKSFSQEHILSQAIDHLMNFNMEMPVHQIAESLSLSARSFNRLFHHHLGIAPVSFRKIARFRHSMQNWLFNDRFKNLTEIGYASNFYDQSYFIKMYKKVTGSNPAKFFKSIEKLADDRLIFQFIHK